MFVANVVVHTLGCLWKLNTCLIVFLSGTATQTSLSVLQQPLLDEEWSNNK